MSKLNSVVNKYSSIIKIALKSEFAYKFQFIIGRLRNIIQIVVFYFLWQSVFVNNDSAFGYTASSIGVYTFLLIIIRSIVTTTRVNDVSGYVSSGDLSNYLLKPINFFKLIIVRDIPVKFLNILFSFVEILLLFLLLKPDIFFQTDFLQIIFFLISIVIATAIFFFILMIANALPFWVPEAGWGAQFFALILIEFLSGAFFPLDVFPKGVETFLRLTPFPYLFFIPIKTYLGNLNLVENMTNIGIGMVWVIILFLMMNKIWKRGLKVYEGGMGR